MKITLEIPLDDARELLAFLWSFESIEGSELESTLPCPVKRIMGEITRKIR